MNAFTRETQRINQQAARIKAARQELKEEMEAMDRQKDSHREPFGTSAAGMTEYNRPRNHKA